MTQKRSSTNSNTSHCAKSNCHRSLPSHQPASYTNGLCEQHFFEMNLSINDSSIKYQDQPLKNDIRNTREIFDGHQWRIIEQKIDQGQIITDQDNLDKPITKDNLLQLFRLLTNYQIIKEIE